ncbi:PAC2 family protein [Natronococcus wangiae]|uniref:PAC2 family protein n=1 Tax=Natronococcus wangiae TaxID=3068275 RepID=UPI00273E0099|nr:PAC2 family protein [Natronococcus sp. AD5]
MGLPGYGLGISIAVDQITEQLELEQYGAIQSDALPPVASSIAGRAQDTVCAYSETNPDVLTPHSDVPMPEDRSPN